MIDEVPVLQPRRSGVSAARQKPDWITTGLLLAVTAAYLLPITQILYSVRDDGTVLYGAVRVSEGAVPGRDFVEVMGPGTFYWLGLFFKLFGAGWQVSHVVLLLTGVATAGVLYAIALQVCSRKAALLSWLSALVMGMPLWPVVSHHWDSNLFAFCAVWCYLKFENTAQPVWAAAAGILAALTTCFMQPKGVLLLLAFAVSAVLRRIRARGDAALPVGKALGMIAGSYAAIGVAVLGAFLLSGALPGLIYTNIVWPLSGYGEVNAVPWGYGLITLALNPSFHEFHANQAAIGLLSAGLSLVPFLVLAALPLIATGFALRAFVKRNGQIRWNPALAVFLGGGSLWLSEIHRKDIVHLAFGAPLLLVALLACLRRLERFQTTKILAGVLATGLVVFGALNFRDRMRGLRRIETRRGSVMSAADYGGLPFLDKTVKAGDYVFVYPYTPIYYYLAGVRNPTRYSILLYGYNTPAQFNEVIRDLEVKRVRYVLNSGSAEETLRGGLPGYHQPPENQLQLERYLEQRYEVVGAEGRFRILERKEMPDSAALRKPSGGTGNE